MLACVGGTVGDVLATEIVLKDGRVLRGSSARLPASAEPPQAPNADGSGAIQSILLLDDDLRRTFFSDRLVREVHQEENRQVDEKFTIRQRVPRRPAIKSSAIRCEFSRSTNSAGASSPWSRPRDRSTSSKALPN